MIAKILVSRKLRVYFSLKLYEKRVRLCQGSSRKKKLNNRVFPIIYSCGKVYTNETCHSIKTKLKKHSACIHHEKIKKTAIGFTQLLGEVKNVT